MSGVTLYNYFRSTTSIRVRAALNLKGVEYRYVAVSLTDGAQHGEFRDRNVEGLVPWLELDDGRGLSQSLAIIEYLDETVAEPPLLPADAFGRARVRSLALSIACDVHPLNNLRVLLTLKNEFDADQRVINDWARRWIHPAFDSLEKRLADDPESGEFCHGDRPTLADICLFAQMFNNDRFGVAPDRYPRSRAIFERCLTIDAFRRAAPDAQPDSG